MWNSQEAAAAYRRFALEWAGGQTHEPDGPVPNVGRLVVRWLDHCAATYQKRGKFTSEVHCNRAAMRPLADLYGHEPAAEFTPPKLRAVREAMVQKGWARKTVNDHVSRILRAFGWGVTELIVPVSVHAALALVEPIQAGRRSDLAEGEGGDPVPQKHIDAVLAGKHLHPNPNRRAVLGAMIQLQLLSAMRPGELCGLRADQIDRTRTTWRYHVTEFNKMLHRDIGRPVLFGPQARKLLAPFLKRTSWCFGYRHCERARPGVP